MSATAVYIEQVIIGFCTLAAVGMMLFGCVPDVDRGIVTGAVIVGASYVVGILTDRCADTLLDRLGRWNRLRFALHGRKELPFKDPLAAYDKNKFTGGNDRVSYLESRLRLMRAMTALLPALTIAFLVTRAYAGPRWLIFAMTIAIYLTVPLLSFEVAPVPGTHELKKLSEIARDDAGCFQLAIFPSEVWREPALIAYALLAIEAAGVVAASCDRASQFAIALAGFALTLLTGWSWLRISDTYVRVLNR